MPEGTTAYTGPDGVRHETTFQYDYAPPPQPPQELDQAAVAEGLRSGKVDDALKQIHAAQYFLGSRLLKQAQEKNDTNGVMRAMLMMFPQQATPVAPILKAYGPPPVITPQQKVVNEQNDRKVKVLEKKASAPPPDKYFHWQGAIVKVPGAGGDPVTLKEAPPKPVTFTEKLDSDQLATPEILAKPAEKRSLFGIDWLAKDVPAVEGQPAKPFRPAGTYRSQLQPATPTSTAPEPAAKAASKFKTADEVREAYRAKTIDRDAAKKILAEQFNLK